MLCRFPHRCFAGFLIEDGRRLAGRDRIKAGGAEETEGHAGAVLEEEGTAAEGPGFTVVAIEDERKAAREEGEDPLYLDEYIETDCNIDVKVNVGW